MVVIYKPEEKETFLAVDDEHPPFPLSHLFDDFFSPRPLFSLSRRPWNPPTDVYETQDFIVIKMELAGMNEDDIEITLENNILTIQGHRAEEHPGDKKNYHLMELHYGNFQRVFSLPGKFTRNDINATYKDGFLKITIPKTSAPPREVKTEVEGE